MSHINHRYREMLANGDPHQQEIARRQLAHARRTSEDKSGQRRRSRWADVPLAELFAEASNEVRVRGNGTVECGHEPHHGSKSGRCVVIDPIRGLWYCRSCRRGGDAVRFVMDLHGWPYAPAVDWLVDRYGERTRMSTRRSRCTKWVEA